MATSHRPDTMPGYQMDSHNNAMQSPTRYTILTFPLSVSLGVACLVFFLFLEGNILAMGNLFAASPPIRIYGHSVKAQRTKAQDFIPLDPRINGVSHALDRRISRGLS